MPRVNKVAAKSPPKKKLSKKKGVKKQTAGGGILDRIHSLSDGLPEIGIKINIYGQSGTGKTTFWGTFPGRILAIIASGNDHPGELRTLDGPDTRDKVDYVTITDSAQILDLVEHVEETGEYSTVVVDHVSGLQDLILMEVLNLKHRPEQLSWGIAKQEQWGEVANIIKQRLRALLNLTCNVVIIAQERVFEFEAEDDSVLMPYVASGVTPSVAGWLNPAVDYIVQTHKRQKTKIQTAKVAGKTVKKEVPADGVEYMLRVGPHTIFTTKFRKPKGGDELPVSILDPTYDKLMKYITDE